MGKLKLPAAKGICDECLSDPLRVIANKVGIFVFCKHNQTGAQMYKKPNGELTGQWLMHTPANEEAWNRDINFIFKTLGKTEREH